MTQSTKKCWSCDTVTPFDQGWCSNCRLELPPDILMAVELSETEPYAGALRLAVADAHKAQKRRTLSGRQLSAAIMEGKKIDLDDLDI